MDLIYSLSNFDLYRVAKSGILTVQEASSGQNDNDILGVPKIYPILKLNFEVVNISMRKMLDCPHSRNMYKSFDT